MNGTKITAHSGCEGTQRDSMEAVDLSIAMQVDGIEVDVRMDEAGELRLSHDERADYTGAGYLKDVFEKIKANDMFINCDIKETRTIYPVLDLAESFSIPRDRLIFSGFVPCGLILADPGIAERAQIYMNIENIISEMSVMDCLSPEKKDTVLNDRFGDFIRVAKRLGASALNCHYTDISEAMLSLLEAERLPVSLWTVNDPDVMAHYLARGVGNITTLCPRKAMELRKG